jgi:xanthine/uracil permease
MENEKEKFTYSYSSKQQEEIQSIRLKYVSKEEDKLEQLHRLDQRATKSGTIISIIVGFISTLIFGLGMSCTMVWADTMFIPGIVIGVIGLIGISLAYPIYNVITKKQREKLTPQIMKLTDELMKLSK